MSSRHRSDTHTQSPRLWPVLNDSALIEFTTSVIDANDSLHFCNCYFRDFARYEGHKKHDDTKCKLMFISMFMSLTTISSHMIFN